MGAETGGLARISVSNSGKQIQYQGQSVPLLGTPIRDDPPVSAPIRVQGLVLVFGRRRSKRPVLRAIQKKRRLKGADLLFHRATYFARASLLLCRAAVF